LRTLNKKKLTQVVVFLHNPLLVFFQTKMKVDTPAAIPDSEANDPLPSSPKPKTVIGAHDVEEGFQTDDERESAPLVSGKRSVHASALFRSSLEVQGQKQGEVLRCLNLSHPSEVAYITALLSDHSKQGHTSFNYTWEVWSDWFKEKTSGDTVKEYAMLNGLQKYLHHKGYETAVTRPYRSDEKEKYFLHISWNRSHRFAALENLNCTYSRAMNFFWLLMCFIYISFVFLVIVVSVVHYIFSS